MRREEEKCLGTAMIAFETTSTTVVSLPPIYEHPGATVYSSSSSFPTPTSS